jgi:hypothetical protein
MFIFYDDKRKKRKRILNDAGKEKEELKYDGIGPFERTKKK